jgi:glucose-6-phosphate 1-dehydrogenase
MTTAPSTGAPALSTVTGPKPGSAVKSHVVPVAACDFVVFGGTGDLAMRKLLPSLYRRDVEAQVTPDTRIISLARDPITDAQYRSIVDERARRYADVESPSWERFLERLHHVTVEAGSDEGWADVAGLLAQAPDRVRVFYLACPPQLFGTVCQRLREAGVVSANSRVVLEKPIGWDLESARRINDQVGAAFEEHQTFRIDHYLGKETVQNLLVLRFANTLLEPLWNNRWIDHVQITVAETVGVGARADYYDTAGAMRDMVQNHLLQLLCLVAMEAPTRIDMDDVRDEKLKVLQALRPLEGLQVASSTVRGQYRSGVVDGAAVPGYADELGEGRSSSTETFVALKAAVDNWRWADVPFYLRTGKRMHTRTSEIVMQFRPVPHSIFPRNVGQIMPNMLVMHLQPDESVRLHLMAKEPGPGGLRLRPAPLNLSFAETFKIRSADAYERLLMDVVRGNPTLFMRRDEVETAWQWTEPILDAWSAAEEPPKSYPAGSTGPSAAIALIERDGRTWHEEAYA